MATIDTSMVAKLPLFAGLSRAELDAVLKEAQSIRVPKNGHVFEQERTPIRSSCCCTATFAPAR